MPIYEYRCDECGHQFDYVAKRLTDAPDVCPECGTKTLKKLLSAFSAKMGERRSARDGAASCPTGTCCPTGSCSL